MRLTVKIRIGRAAHVSIRVLMSASDSVVVRVSNTRAPSRFVFLAQRRAVGERQGRTGHARQRELFERDVGREQRTLQAAVREVRQQRAIVADHQQEDRLSQATANRNAKMPAGVGTRRCSTSQAPAQRRSRGTIDSSLG